MVQDDTKTPDVGFEVARFPLHHFGSHKGDRARNFLDRLVFAKFCSHTQIANFYDRLLACILTVSCSDENVEMLNVTMDYAHLMHVIDTLCGL